LISGCRLLTKRAITAFISKSKFNKISINGGTARYSIHVDKPALRAELADQGDQYVTLKPGEEKKITVKFKNTGNVIWENKGPNAIHLGSSAPEDRLSELYYKDGWQSKYRPAGLNETIVYPGGTGTFTFKIKPGSRGVYKEYFQLVIENVGWVAGSGVEWYFRVFGETVKQSSGNLNDAAENKKRAAIITGAKKTTTTNTTKTTAATANTKPAEEKSPQYSPPAVGGQPFRVKLSYGGENSVLTADKNYAVTDGGDNRLFTLSAGQETLVRRVGGNIHVQTGSTTKDSSVIRLVPEDGGIAEIKTWEHRPEWNTALNDNKFRGVIEIRVINDQVAYINELPLEDYLKGLAEVSNNSPFEKQKTIAVLARTYARFYMEDENRKFPGLPYDGSDDPDIFQKYLGYGAETRLPNFVGAVAITANEVVTYQGKLIKTPYFNQSDGRTRSAMEVWGWTDTPYLQSVPDPWCEGITKTGHGVGLSGYGATAQANEGKTYDEIIKYYYKGVDVNELNFN
jgi:peptidoglycan hydrolase-like amidase